MSKAHEVRLSAVQWFLPKQEALEASRPGKEGTGKHLLALDMGDVLALLEYVAGNEHGMYPAYDLRKACSAIVEKYRCCLPADMEDHLVDHELLHEAVELAFEQALRIDQAEEAAEGSNQ